MADFIPQPNCADPSTLTLLTVDEARAEIDALVTPVDSGRQCVLHEALGQILYQPVISTMQVPAYDNSAMDGYALRGSDIQSPRFTLKQVGKAFAGKPYRGKVNSGECVRIMTGAIMPQNCDSVVMQEHTEVHGDLITMHGSHKMGQNVRLAGEDIASGARILPAGRRLTPADLGLLASIGIAEVVVKRRLSVAFFSSGDELRSIGETLELGQIYDSNRYTLYGMLKRLDADITDMGVVKDDPETLKQTLLNASHQADVVISSGGVSVGEADYIKDILSEIGSVKFWKVAMKPGSPLTYGRINQAVFFGLPGNPVSVMITFYQFVQTALKKMAGETVSDPILLTAICDDNINKRLGRSEFQRGVLYQDDSGQLHVTSTGPQGSAMLHSMSLANCFIVLDKDCNNVQAGQQVTVQPFAGLV